MIRCAECERPAVFRVKGGRVHADKDHDLCKRCWRDAVNRDRVRGVVQG